MDTEKGERRDPSLVHPEPVLDNQDDLELEPPNLEGWQNDVDMSDDNIQPGIEENENPNRTTEEAAERMQLRQRAPAPIPAV